MAKHILTQSANGRAIDCTDLIAGNNNYTDLGGDMMDVLLHKPADATTEKVSLLLSNPSNKRITFYVDFNGQGLTMKLDRKSSKQISFTVYGWNANDPAVSIRKFQGDELLVMGGAES